eukprot:362732-Chlamydomonas_euryale.AAC.6
MGFGSMLWLAASLVFTDNVMVSLRPPYPKLLKQVCCLGVDAYVCRLGWDAAKDWLRAGRGWQGLSGSCRGRGHAGWGVWL